MIIVYDSLTGQTKRFASKLGFDIVDIKEASAISEDERIFLVTRTFNFGEIPESTEDFLDDFKHKVIGLAVSGNRNWGSNYGAAGDKIQANYGIPLVLKFEASGMPHEIQMVKDWLKSQQV